MPSTLPTIAIVGRPNVGKSSLLNAIAGRRISIVQDMPGVTRDRVSTPIQLDGHYVDLVDTGGYGFVDSDQLSDHIHHQIELAMFQANLVLFLVDCQQGLTSVDETIASLLRTKGIKTLLVANKADTANADMALGDFARLGLGTPVGVSATLGRNIDDLIEAIKQNIDLSKAPTELLPPQMHMAIVGKRNAGKSTLVNAIAGLYEGDPERVIVSEVPGTTRDSIDVRFEKDGKSLIVIDTAGVRKKRHMVTNDIEFYSFHRAQRSIRRADVVLMLLDGAAETVSEPDKKLGQYIAEQLKPVILVVNKWDLVREMQLRQMKEEERAQGVDDKDLMEKFRVYIDHEIRHLDYAPIAFLTAKDGRNVQSVVDLAQHLFKQANERVGTGKLNQVVQQILEERQPPNKLGRRVRIYYATQPEVSPPTIVLFVNKPELLSVSYQRFMVNRFRELLPYAEVPIKLVLRGRSVKSEPGETPDDSGVEKLRPQARPARAKPKAFIKPGRSRKRARLPKQSRRAK